MRLNMLEARRSRREEPVGGDLPDPVAHRGDDHDPERLALVEPAPSTSSSV
jgi:hypothetical protein